MFKKLLFISLTMLLGSTAFADTENKVPAVLQHATVFANGAQLFHSANYSIKAGVTTIIVEQVAPRLNAESIQIKMNGSVVVLDSKFRIHSNAEDTYAGVSAANVKRLRVLEDSVRLMGNQIRSKNDALEVLIGTKNMILNNGLVKGQGKVNDSIELLQKTVEYYQKKVSELNASIQAVQADLNEWKRKETALQRRLSELKSEVGASVRNGVPQIVITVQSTVAMTGKMEISYLVQDAGWTPIYDLHGAVEEGKVNLNYKAHVRQNTGLKWENVTLTISTNNPTLNKTKPTLHPWYASFQQHRVTQANKPMVTNMQTGIRYKNEMANTDNAEYKMEERSVQDFTNIVQHGISAEFKISLPYTIESNNQLFTVLIRNVDLNAKYSYYVVPKMEKAAYLVAQVNKLEELNLVPGKANIYFDGSYMGETYVDPSMLDDTLRLSLGKDPNIIVRRNYLTQEKKEKLVGASVEKTEYYYIEVRNQKANPIEVVIQDQVPISQLNDVTIELIDTNKATHNAVTGLIEWRKVIKPRQSEQIKFGFKIKHPKDQPVYY